DDIRLERERLEARLRALPGCVTLAGAGVGLEAVADLVGPEALQTHQRLVQRLEVVERDLADGLDGAQLASVELLDRVTRLHALGGEADAHRAAVLVRALVV